MFTVASPLLTIESVKAVSEVFNPIEGTLTEINTNLKKKPEVLNQAPYTDGWLFKIKFTNPNNTMELLTSLEYEEYLKTL